MKIICIRCKTVLGEQEPWDDPTEKAAKCPNCIEAEKEEAIRKERMNSPKRGREIAFEDGLKGIISLVGADTPKLSFWDLEVGGKIFSCLDTTRDNLQKYLGRIEEDQVDVMFFHSMSVPLPPKGRGKKKAPEPAPTEDSKSVSYNCTIRMPKHLVLPMFDDKARRLKNVCEILSKAVQRDWEKERQAVAQGDKPEI